MPSIPHVFRRGAVYTFRRRAGPRGPVLQVSLRTADPVVARRLSPLVSAACDMALQDLRRGMLTLDEVRHVLEHVVRKHLAKLEAGRVAEPLSDDSLQKARRLDLLSATAMRLLAERGPGVTAAALDAQGWSDAGLAPEDAKALDRQLDYDRTMYWNSGRDDRLELLLAAAIGRLPTGPAEIEQARRILLRGHAAAVRANARHRQTAAAEEDALAERLAREILDGPIAAPQAAPVAAAAPAVPAASARPAPHHPADEAPEADGPEVDDRLSAIRELMAADKARSGLSPRTVDQMWIGSVP